MADDTIIAEKEMNEIGKSITKACDELRDQIFWHEMRNNVITGTVAGVVGGLVAYGLYAAFKD